MERFVQIGTAALRSPEGDFLPAEPIYRSEERRSQKAVGQSYIDADVLGDIFASKCSSYLKEKKINERGPDIPRNRSGRVSDLLRRDDMGDRSMTLCPEEKEKEEE